MMRFISLSRTLAVLVVSLRSSSAVLFVSRLTWASRLAIRVFASVSTAVSFATICCFSSSTVVRVAVVAARIACICSFCCTRISMYCARPSKVGGPVVVILTKLEGAKLRYHQTNITPMSQKPKNPLTPQWTFGGNTRSVCGQVYLTLLLMAMRMKARQDLRLEPSQLQ